ncbi:DUF3617 domain-containing protein [Sulfurimonas sp.]|uniref:DUF3617 domain-containing protein n=1 Tax=Sulfurimonas sp. TaxID=2022749 RepID=UPI00356929DD
MKKLLTYPVFILLSLAVFSVNVYSKQLDIKEGMWSWSVRMEMMGMVVPSTTYSDCITKEDLVPQEKQQANGCKVIEKKIVGNTVKWKIECKDENGKSTSTGKITYTKTTAKGEIVVNAQGMNMKSNINGKYIGSCK